MKRCKLFLLYTLFAFSISACKKDHTKIERSNENIVMNGAQVAPPNSSPATGTLKVSYSSDTKLLNYTIMWNGLTGNVTAIHLHGPTDPGFAAPVIQTLTPASSPNSSGYPTTPSGSYSASLFVDGVLVKQEELLAGKYYIDIHTAARYSASGEIRGQIVFNN